MYVPGTYIHPTILSYYYNKLKTKSPILYLYLVPRTINDFVTQSRRNDSIRLID